MCNLSVHICEYWAEAIMQQYVHHQLTNFASQRLCKTWQSARASLPWATDSKLWKGFVFKGFHQSFIFFLWTWKLKYITFTQNIRNQLKAVWGFLRTLVKSETFIDLICILNKVFLQRVSYKYIFSFALWRSIAIRWKTRILLKLKMYTFACPKTYTGGGNFLASHVCTACDESCD